MKKRYKQTEAGVIPEEWTPSTIGALKQFQGGSQPPRSTFIFSKNDGYVRLLQIRDYKNDKYITYVPKHLAKRFCDKEDIMIGRYGLPIFQILRGMEGAYNVALIKAIPQGQITQKYAYHFLKQEKLFFFIEKLSQRSSGQTGIDLEGLRSYPFPVPSLSEQTAIATALSDTDALISGLEKLIAKKRNVKQGAMQELLTGKRRLQGFEKQKGYKQTEVGTLPEDWDVENIPNLINRTNGIKIGPFGSQLKKELLVKSGYKVYGQENVFNNDVEIGDRFINNGSVKNHAAIFPKFKSSL